MDYHVTGFLRGLRYCYWRSIKRSNYGCALIDLSLTEMFARIYLIIASHRTETRCKYSIIAISCTISRAQSRYVTQKRNAMQILPFLAQFRPIWALHMLFVYVLYDCSLYTTTHTAKSDIVVILADVSSQRWLTNKHVIHGDDKMWTIISWSSWANWHQGQCSILSWQVWWCLLSQLFCIKYQCWLSYRVLPISMSE